MIHHVVQFALRQRFLVLMFTILVIVAGALAFRRMPVDAYPDLSPPRVEIISQWPGHAAEEVERLITIPLEVEMNGIPKLDYAAVDLALRAVVVTMNFQYDTDPYFAREQAFERIGDAQVPTA